MNNEMVIHSDGTVHKKTQAFGADMSSWSLVLDAIRSISSPQERRCAQITVCAYATGRDDAQNLLEMLGLMTHGTS